MTTSRVNLGGGFTVEFSISQAGLSCAWSPSVPSGIDRERMLPRYIAARDAFLCNSGFKCALLEAAA